MQTQLIDRFGNPLRRETLTEEIAAATLTGVRSPMTGYPADGLTPVRLATILREADGGDPVRYLELAETIEERDLHYVGVLGTRRRSVSQLDITVDAGSEDAAAEAIAQDIRNWLKRDELSQDLFDILDCISKGISFTEILWDSSEGQWQPSRLEWRDPRWFRYERSNLTTPRLLSESGQELDLPAFKFVVASIKSKSGLPLRSGLARVASWSWMFKAFTQRDWAIFTQTYGQPLRLGKYGQGASAEEKSVLFRAVANIAGDCAAIIPESMTIDFVEAGNVGAAHQLYKERADWLDQQLSKAVLGQTATTDAVTGGLGSGKEHREVQKDIETADARALAAILNRDLIRPWVQLNHGPQKVYPRLKIGRPEEEDLAALAAALGPMIDRGLEVDQATIRERFNLPEAKSGAKLLRPQGSGEVATAAAGQASQIKRVSGEIKRVEALPGSRTALQSERASAANSEPDQIEALLSDRMEAEAAPALEAFIARIEAMVGAATDLGELRAMLSAGFPEVAADGLSDVIAKGLIAAHLGGRVVVAEEAE